MEQKSLWSTLKIGTDLCIIKIDRGADDSSFTFWLSDFKTLWSETIVSKDEVIKRADINPTISIDDNITDQLIRAIGKVENVTVTNTNIDPNDIEINLQMTYPMEGEISFKFNWELKKCETKQFFDQITKILMQQIFELENHKRQLIDTVKRKDDEIKQYKIEGAPELMRKRFITEEFKEDAFVSQCRTFNCDVQDFQSIIGPLPEDDTKVEKAKEVSVSPVKIIERRNHSSPRGLRHNRRLFREHKPIVPRGVVYDDDEDSDAATNNEPKQQDDASNAAK